jgi:hypothetical protein
MPQAPAGIREDKQWEVQMTCTSSDRIRRLRKIGFALAVGSAWLALGSGMAQADCIRRVVSTEGYATLGDGKEKAMYNALIAWSMQVKNVADPSYSSWSKAQGKSENCTAGKTWTCVVRATPCN